METNKNFPMIDEAVRGLTSSSQWSKEISGEEMTALMVSVIRSLLADQQSVQVDINKVNVRFTYDSENNKPRANVIGSLQVKKPISAVIDLVFVFENDNEEGGIKLEDHCVEEKAEGFIAKTALRAVNISSKVQTALKDTNLALENALKAQFKDAGVELTAVSAHITKTGLFLLLHGSKS